MTRVKYFVIFCALAFGCLLVSQAEAAKGQLTDQEKYVLQQVSAGKVADLKVRFGKKKENRQLSGRFLEDLLTGSYKVHRKGVMIENAVIIEPLDLEDAQVLHNVTFYNCIFENKLIFQDTVFAKNLGIINSHFDEEGNFHRVKVKKNLFCNNSTFQGPVDFGGADIGGQFIADGVQFQNEKVDAIFNGLKVGQSAFFINATFKGPVNFGNADIGRQFAANGAVFLSQRGANFKGLRVGQATFFQKAAFKGPVDFMALKAGHAFFDNATFHGPVGFVAAEIGGQFSANGAKFLSQEHMAIFNGLKVGQHAFFQNATFQGPVDFTTADIGREFNIIGARFLNAEKEIKFHSLEVGQNAFFTNVIFHGKVSFMQANIGGQFLLIGADGDKKDNASCLSRLILLGTVNQRELRLENFKLATLEASHLRVKGPATIEKVSIKEYADFQNATIEALEFNNIQWPEDKTNLKLGGLTYTSLVVDEPNNFPGLLGFVEKSAFNPQNYLELEKYCTRAGHQDWADDVYIAMKDRELAQMGWYNPARWLVWIFWGRLAGYGRYPFRIFWVALFIIIIGAIFRFNPEYLEVNYSKQWQLNYQTKFSDIVKKGGLFKNFKELKTLGMLWVLRLITSFDQFIPAIDLGLAKNWQPPELSFWPWVHIYSQKILGWILVPIGLAAIYSQFK